MAQRTSLNDFYKNPNLIHYEGESELNEKRKHIFYCWPKLKKNVTGSVLDVGAGQGHVTDRLTKENPRVKKVLVIDTGKYHKGQLVSRGYLFVDHNIDTYPYLTTKERFDTVVSTDVVEHLLSPYLHLLECHRLLKDGGKLILVTPDAKEKNISRVHLNYFTARGLETSLKRIGFRKITRVYNGVLSESVTAILGHIPLVRNLINDGLYYVAEK